MLETFFEIVRFLALAAALWLFIRADKSVRYCRRGFLLIKIGFLLILFGVFMSIIGTLNIPGWGTVGGIGMQVFLEKLVGYAAGSLLLLVGLWHWLPSIRTMDEVQEELDCVRRDLQEHFQARTDELERAVEARRKAEAAMRIEDERRRAIYEESPVGISHGFVGGKHVERNQAFARMLGYGSPREMVEAQAAAGDPYSHFADREDAELLHSLAAEGKSAKGMNVRMRRKDGEIIWVRLDATTILDHQGKSYYFYAFVLDITEQKLSRDALARNENRLQAIINSLPVGIFVVDLERHTLLGANPAALRLVGYERQEIVGSPCRGTLCGGEGDCPLDLRDGLTCVSESDLTRKDGTRVPVMKNIVGAEVDGHRCLVVGVQDMTEQKRLEELRADVARIVAHDLKAPIIGMINGCRLLLMEEGRIDGEIREMLELIETQGSKALLMIGLSLDLYKIEAGTYEYRPVRVDLMGTVRQAARNLEGHLRTKRLELSVRLGGEPDNGRASLMIPANPLLLEAMLSNLLLNALEAAPDDTEIRLEVSGNGEAVLTLTNNGAVPEAIRDTFFEKYTTLGKSGGTGLGTYSVRLAATAMRGTVDLSVSDEDDSTTITVRLPMEG
jgi:PAS domain S-box-containing protein